MDLSLSSKSFKTLEENNNTWHSVQVHSSEKSKNQHIVGKLPPFPLEYQNSMKLVELEK